MLLVLVILILAVVGGAELFIDSGDVRLDCGGRHHGTCAGQTMRNVPNCMTPSRHTGEMSGEKPTAQETRTGRAEAGSAVVNLTTQTADKTKRPRPDYAGRGRLASWHASGRRMAGRPLRGWLLGSPGAPCGTLAVQTMWRNPRAGTFTFSSRCGNVFFAA